MKTIGLIGGTSWESTAEYYRLINEEVRHRLGSYHSASLVLKSLNFEEVVRAEIGGQWDQSTQLLVNAAKALESAGADCVLICANALHRRAREVERAIRLPLLHVADVTVMALRRAKVRKAGLLGMSTTMEETFLTERLTTGHAFDIVIPNRSDREHVHRIILEELCRGEVRDESRRILVRIVENMRHLGARGVILACTELTLLLKQEHSALPLFDTTELHALAAVEWALRDVVPVA